MKRSLKQGLGGLVAALVLSLILAIPSVAGTYQTLIRVAPGPVYTGLASSVQVTIYDNLHNALVTASNAPGGIAFAEEGTTGSYWAAYSVDTSKLPISVTATIAGQSLTFAPITIGNERAAEVADGYTTSLTSSISGTNARVTTALPSAAPAASGGLPTVGAGSGQINPISGTFSGVTLTTAEETAIVNAWMTRSLGHQMTAGQLLVLMQARNVAPVTNSWSASTHLLNTAFVFSGDLAAILTDATLYPSSQTTAPAVQSVTRTLGTVPQP